MPSTTQKTRYEYVRESTGWSVYVINPPSQLGLVRAGRKYFFGWYRTKGLATLAVKRQTNTPQQKIDHLLSQADQKIDEVYFNLEEVDDILREEDIDTLTKDQRSRLQDIKSRAEEVRDIWLS